MKRFTVFMLTIAPICGTTVFNNGNINMPKPDYPASILAIYLPYLLWWLCGKRS